MKRRNLFILLALFIALVVVAAFQAQQRSVIPTPESTPVGSFLGRDLNLAVLDIQAIQLRNPNTGASFVISRDINGNWTAPGTEGSLDTAAASNIARTVVLAGYQQSLPVTDATDLSEYGFRPTGSFEVDILRTNNEGHVIAVGELLPSGLAYYALVDDKPLLFFIERGAVDYLMVYLEQPPIT